MLNGYDPVTGVGNMANLNSKVGAGGSVVPRWGYLFRGVKRGRPWARAARTLLSLHLAATTAKLSGGRAAGEALWGCLLVLMFGVASRML